VLRRDQRPTSAPGQASPSVSLAGVVVELILDGKCVYAGGPRESCGPVHSHIHPRSLNQSSGTSALRRISPTANG
jgi:hypothetical protein